MACVGNASGNIVPFLLTATFVWLPLEVGAGNFTYMYMTEYYIVREILAPNRVLICDSYHLPKVIIV